MLWHVLYLIPKGYALHHNKFPMLRFVTIASPKYFQVLLPSHNYFTVIVQHEEC